MKYIKRCFYIGYSDDVYLNVFKYRICGLFLMLIYFLLFNIVIA